MLLIAIIAGALCISASCKKHEMILGQPKIISADKEEGTNSVKKDVSDRKSPCLDKNARTAVQRKMDTNLICAAHPPHSSEFRQPKLRTDSQGRILIDIRTTATDDLLLLIRSLGGRIVSESPTHKTILAYIPLEVLEKIAESQDVFFMMPAAEATTN